MMGGEEGEIGIDEEVKLKSEIGEDFVIDGVLEEDGVQRSDPVYPFASGKVEVKLEQSDSKSEPESDKSRKKKLKHERELARLRSQPAFVPDPLGTFECDKCGLEFVTQNDLKAHNAQSHVRHLKCQYCDKEFQHGRLALHVKAAHPDKCSRKLKTSTRRKFICTKPKPICLFCKQKFKQTNHLKNHLFSCHSREGAILCRVDGCNQKCSTTRERTNHEIKVHRFGGNNHKCLQCPEWTGLTKAEFKQHSARVHPTEEDMQRRAAYAAGNKKVPCTHCQIVFKNVRDLKDHITLKHSGRPGLSCRVKGCRQKFSFAGARTNHEVRVHRFQGKTYICPKCPQWSFLTLAELKRHTKSHRSAGDKPKVCVNPYQYPCTYSSCRKWFDNVKDLKFHISEKHSGEPGISCRVEGCRKKFFDSSARCHHEVRVHRFGGRLHKCPQCPEWVGFTTKEFKKHSERVHHIEEDKREQCVYCEKTFARRFDLKMHQTFHTGIKLFKCTEPDCDKSYNVKLRLESHINWKHKGEKPFQCEFCERSCASKSLLKAHVLNVHCAPEDKKFACQHCDLKFGTKPQLENHTLKHTREKRFLCEKCGMSYGSKSGLNKHIMFKHKYDEDVQEQL